RRGVVPPEQPADRAGRRLLDDHDALLRPPVRLPAAPAPGRTGAAAGARRPARRGGRSGRRGPRGSTRMNAPPNAPFVSTRTRRPRVLVSCDHYLPGVKAGGPIRSISGLVSALGSELDFRIVTRDRDLGADERYAGVRPGQWYARDGAQVLYWPPSGA